MDNIGETGVESIRLKGMRISELPIAENALARPQLPLAEDVQRKNGINNILAGAPKQSVAYLKSRTVECQQNIERISALKAREGDLISEYSGLIRLCEMRDTELEKLESPQEIADLKKRFPPYDIDRMKQQIVQSTESIARSDVVIAKEHDGIAELREVMALCKKRDSDLRNLGARVA